MNRPVIAVEHLTKRFGEVIAVNNLTFTVTYGDLFGLVGPDGSGKTTLIRLLAGIMTPSAGQGNVLGSDLATGISAVRKHIGYLSQGSHLYNDLTVDENLRFFAGIFQLTSEHEQERIAELLSFSRLEPFRDRLAGQLSGGMRRKLALCCAMIHSPSLFLLDEPTTGVDPVSREEVWELIRSVWRDGATFLISTPYMDEAELCTRVGFLYQGALLHEGSPADLKKLLPGEIWEVRCDEMRKAREILGKLREVGKVNLFGDRLHLQLDPGEERWSLFEAMLQKEGIRMVSKEPIEPTLEDIFLLLVNRDG
ncbi:MAG: ABC transporter ATP-binding protein [Candidatus Tectomicrobia bacterium]|nr:ABC transporter ATP-binding protein [Candidatus Tectomicrobia bacterium]